MLRSGSQGQDAPFGGKGISRWGSGSASGKRRAFVPHLGVGVACGAWTTSPNPGFETGETVRGK